MRALAARLIAYEAKGSGRSGKKAPLAFGSVVEMLRQPLATLTGAAGFRSLLSRALAVANEEVRWLRAVHVKADGSLECPDLAQLDREEIVGGEVALVAQLLVLLVTFIGGPLTQRLVQDVWPKAPFDKLDFDKAEK